jgi:citrate lyase alpha subunit
MPTTINNTDRLQKLLVATQSVLDAYAMACNLIRNGIKFEFECEGHRHMLTVCISEDKLPKFMQLVTHINATILPLKEEV